MYDRRVVVFVVVVIVVVVANAQALVSLLPIRVDGDDAALVARQRRGWSGVRNDDALVRRRRCSSIFLYLTPVPNKKVVRFLGENLLKG
jgi:hypothetical protein